ncbi:Phospho-N-acetylmuramoyl-pentapeptide- transferase [Rickettsiales bacterium Ac37b]|nr:Phospho-N-acetylmuramoyl-pentapeptide- transferase [Rickettsiales bacterium Ac37b]
MLYHLLFPLSEVHSVFNIFRYITFRSSGALLTSLFLSFFIAPKIIKFLNSIQNGGQPIRDDGPESHLLTKQGTPTMGGIIILISAIGSTFIWSNLSNQYILIVLFTTIGFGFIGFVDDYLKVSKRNHKGVSGKQKLLFQFLISIIVCICIQLITPNELKSHLALPFFKNTLIDLGVFYIIFTSIVITGASNAVNLTDGLDGLAIGAVVIASVCFALISYLVGNIIFANYLQIHYVPGVGEITVFCSAMMGAGLGFLWFNAPPAKIFMGDVGSLSLGASIGVISVITKHEIVLSIIGGLFVMEALSVMIQVYYYKLSGGKRFFKMAPLHHHFEKLGWSESTIVIRFWIIAIIFALIGLSTLKLR